MLSVFETGEATFRLSNARDEEVGWIRDGALGFGRLESEQQAIRAAVAGSDALAAYLERVAGASEHAERKDGPVKVVNDGTYEWVVRGSTQLARLYRPEGDARTRGTFSVEFVLPSYVKDGTAIAAAQVVHHAIGRAVGAGTDGAATAPARALGTADRRATAAGGSSAR